MQTTTYGYRLPDDGDRAKGTSGWFASLEFDIDRLDEHNHDGVNSAALSLSAITAYTNTIPVSVAFTGNTTNTSTTVSSVSSVAGLAVGQPISGTGIPAATTIAAVGTTTITLSAAATATNSTVALTATTWITDSSGYKQTITVPAGVDDVNNYNLKFIFSAPAGVVGQIAYLGYKRLTATTYEVYCNDITAAFTVIYR